MGNGRLAHSRIAMRLAALALIAALAGAVEAEAPLGTADVVRFLRAGISERTILVELKERGFGEALDDARESALREAGATETLIVALRLAARAAAPQPAPAITPDEASRPVAPALGSREPAFAAVTRAVRVPVSVFGGDDRPVMGLKSTDFRVLENGKPQRVTLFSGERQPLRIALALDTSGSMQSKIVEVQSALRHFVDLLEPADQIMVLSFADRVQTLQDFTSDRERLGQVFDMLEPIGGTSLYDAAYESIRHVAAGPAESKAVVLVSDGVDTSSRVSFSQLLEYARRAEVPVFSIGLGGDDLIGRLFVPLRPGPSGGPGGRPHSPWPGGGRGLPAPGGGGRGGWPGGPFPGRSHKRFDPKPLLELADETGGRAEILKERSHYTPDSDEPKGKLKEAVESIAMTLRHRYLLGYEPSQGGEGWRKLKVEVNRPVSEARARKGYYAGG